VLVALLAAAAAGAQAPVRIYGLEVETRGDTQRLLVFADAPLSPRLEHPSGDRLLLVLPRAALDASAPTRVRPDRGGAIALVTASERRGAEIPEVRVEVRHAPGARPELEQRGSMLALAFAGGAPMRRIPLAFENEDLPRVVDTLADAVGEQFIYDEKLRGRVSIASTTPVTAGEARAVLDTVLLLEGFAAVPTPGGPLAILPIQEGKARAPFVREPEDEASEATVTTFLRLEAAEASTVASLLQPWLGQRALAVAQPETNGLILAANEHRLHQLLGVVRLLDQAAAEELLIRRLRHRAVDDVAPLIQEAVGSHPAPHEGARIWTDERTNTLVLQAAPERIEELRRWIERIDQPPPAKGILHVRPVRYADPETLAGILRDLAAGATGAEVGAAGGGAGALRGEVLAGRAFSVVVDRPTHSLVIQADPETFDVIVHVLDELDVPPPSIQVEMLVMEVATDSSLSLGIDALIPFSRPNSTSDWIAGAVLDPTGSGLLQPGTGSDQAFAARVAHQPLLVPIVDQAGNMVTLLVPRETVVVLADQREVQSRVLSRPQLMVLSGEEQEITVGDNIPVPQAATAASDVAGVALQNRVNIARQDVGVTMRVRPTVGQAGRVRLELEIQATRVASSIAGDPQIVGPTIEERQVTSTVWLEDGEVAVVATGSFPEYATTERGTPWLRKVPFFGHFFRANEQRKMDAHLLVTAQVRVHGDAASVLVESVRRRLAMQRILSREGRLAPEDGPYALRIATRARSDDADAIAADLAASGERTRVLSWEWEGVTRWDVYLVGIETPAEITSTSLRARDGGWEPELVVVDEKRSS
jgi:general secretion pathway protein D